MSKKKKQAKNWNQPGLRTPKNTFARRHKLLVVVIIFIVGGSVGVILQRYSMASSTTKVCIPEKDRYGKITNVCHDIPNDNPALYNAVSCTAPGLDIAILTDSSVSMQVLELQGTEWVTNFTRARNAAISLIEALRDKNMTFAVSNMHIPSQATFISNNAQAVAAVQSLNAQPDDGSYLGDVRSLLQTDPRSHMPNLIIVITDGDIMFDPSIKEVKAKGNRVLAVSTRASYVVNRYTKEHLQIAGPKVDTGSIWTSDIVTTDFDKLGPDLLKIANQLKTCPPGSGNGGGGNGSGNNGNGDGIGGTGNGQGRQGTGSGRQGSGSGGGGTSATRQGDGTNPLPTPSPQGSKKQDPPKQEPSPFFDGKLYGIGSDPDAQSPVDLVRSPNKILKNVWFYVIVGILLLAGGVGAGYWFWWRKRS